MSVEIAHTEQRDNHGTMIPHGVSYSATHFGRVILYVWSRCF